MKNSVALSIALAALAAPLWAAPSPAVTGNYLEVRSCNVYAGTCVTNGEMGLTGKEGMLVWSIDRGTWNGAKLDGLNLIAVVAADGTLGNVELEPRQCKSMLILDSRADAQQKAALVDLARSLGGNLLLDIVDVRTSTVDVAFDQSSDETVASVRATGLVDIATHNLAANPGICGNAEIYYPPLTQIKHPRVGYTELAVFKGSGLNRTWDITGVSSAFLGTFSH